MLAVRPYISCDEAWKLSLMIKVTYPILFGLILNLWIGVYPTISYAEPLLFVSTQLTPTEEAANPKPTGAPNYPAHPA